MTESSLTCCIASSSAVRPQASSDSNTGPNTKDSHFVIAKCRRNTEITNNQVLNAQHETSEESDTEEVPKYIQFTTRKQKTLSTSTKWCPATILESQSHSRHSVLTILNHIITYEQRILVVYCRSGRLGAAYYSVQNGELFILEEIVDRPPEFQMFCNLFRQVEPVSILLDGKTQGTFVQKVRKTVFSDTGEGRCKLLFLSAKEYSFEACKRRVLTLSLPNEPSHCSEEERTLFLRTVVDFSQVQSIHALGALLRYLDLNWSSLSLNILSKPQFLSLRSMSLADIVTIDEDTYRGLQIFSTVPHPSGFKKGAQGSNKEGLSLCQLFSKCSSRVGHSRMRVYMQHPTRDLATLRRRQDVVAFFIRPQNDSIMRNICSSLRYIKNVNGILAKIKALSAKSYQWKSLYNTLYNAVLICEMCENKKPSEFLEELASFDNNKLYEMALYMNRIIDFDLSKSEGKFTVKAGVDPELDIKKQTMASLHTLMSETATVELSRLPEFVEECSMLYMPHLGYLLGVKAWADDLTMDQKELPNMKFMFQNNDYIHYKSKGCEELDVMIGDTYPEIVAHETRIMMRLTAIILENLHTLAAVIDKCAELDCLISISKVCKEYNYVRPILTEAKIISIKEGRHPLHTLTCDNFVPNDVESGDQEGCVKILTGPNSSGKSVYMRMIGLIVYLAHIGSFVPAESATIGVISHLHSRLQGAECVAQHMSAFLIDLRQMSLCLRESTANSLILIDEFGKGTARTDGLALLSACIIALLCQENQCPHAIVSTHYHNIKEFVVDSPHVKFLSFEYMLQDGVPVFLFRVSACAGDSSLARAVAATHGVQGSVISRATELMPYYLKNSLPPPNKKITTKLKARVEKTENDLLRDDI